MDNIKVVAYLRLSKEEFNSEKESNSIVNQREIIESFLNQNSDFELVDYYIDNGYSGTNFKNPDLMNSLIFPF